MRDLFDLQTVDRIESQARVVLTPKEDSKIATISGLVRGPYCEFSKTLTADFQFLSSGQASFETTILDPCYWSRQLPFWYELQLTLQFQDGRVMEDTAPISLRRFYREGSSFRWEGKRVVLRGLKYDSPAEHDLRAARQYEAALVLEEPTADVCELASRLGVPIIADLRQALSELNDLLAELAWHPSVLMVLLEQDQLAAHHRQKLYTALSVNAQSNLPDADCDVFAVELTGEERPPRWLADCGKPVVAISNQGYNEIRSARAKCDRLQAALAPEFDLAGYFV